MNEQYHHEDFQPYLFPKVFEEAKFESQRGIFWDAYMKLKLIKSGFSMILKHLCSGLISLILNEKKKFFAET